MFTCIQYYECWMSHGYLRIVRVTHTTTCTRQTRMFVELCIYTSVLLSSHNTRISPHCLSANYWTVKVPFSPIFSESWDRFQSGNSQFCICTTVSHFFHVSKWNMRLEISPWNKGPEEGSNAQTPISWHQGQCISKVFYISSLISSPSARFASWCAKNIFSAIFWRASAWPGFESKCSCSSLGSLIIAWYSSLDLK